MSIDYSYQEIADMSKDELLAAMEVLASDIGNIKGQLEEARQSTEDCSWWRRANYAMYIKKATMQRMYHELGVKNAKITAKLRSEYERQFMLVAKKHLNPSLFSFLEEEISEWRPNETSQAEL